VSLGLSTGILLCVALTQHLRANRVAATDEPSRLEPAHDPAAHADAAIEEEIDSDGAPAATERLRRMRLRDVLGSLTIERLRASIGICGIVAIIILLPTDVSVVPMSFWTAVVLALCVATAGLAATAAGYLATVEPIRLPEGPGLCRGARVIAWIFVLAAASVGLSWVGQFAAVRIFHFVVLSVNAALCYSVLTIKQTDGAAAEAFPLAFGVVSMLGSRPNVLASILDAGERQLGIDLRSTWALTVVRSTLEPLIIGLCLIGWLSTSVTVVDVREQGLVERLGASVGGQPLAPGLHWHWPWPIDAVVRVPAQLVQTLSVGHEGEEGGGPEDVLWARQHAANEFTLLLGNGRDLITVDAAVQFRIADANAWRYHTQNPGDALRAIAYRAVMRNTVNRTLTDALSENVVATTARMRTMVQQDADALGLGVEILGFTVGGMHPPVPVASAYQAVVSAQLGRVTAVVRAQAERNRTLPYAETSVLTSENAARADSARARGLAAGEAWSFLTLQSQYRAAAGEYFFRRRLETLEKDLAGRRFTVVDSRFQRDGGELWVTP
jgi:regulator of protease activity HflC (stomatin/prohibitin superfamily)